MPKRRNTGLKVYNRFYGSVKAVLVCWIIVMAFSGCGDRKAESVRRRSGEDSMFAPGRVEIRQENRFALLLNVKDSLYIIGRVDSGQTAYLLNNETGDYLKCTTGDSLTYFEELSGVNWTLTPLSPQPGSLERFDLCYLESSAFQYRPVEKIAVADAEFVSDLDQQIKISGYIDTLLAYDDAFVTDSLVADSLPSIARIDIPGQEAFVVSYSYMGHLSGPRLAIINNKVFPATGPCSYEYFYPFRIGDRFFIQTGSSCCECGWVIDQVFEIANNALFLVFQDDSYST